MRWRPVSSMSNEPSFALPSAPAWLIAVAALLASPALIVITPSTLASFCRAALTACATAVGLPKLDDGKGSWLDLPPFLPIPSAMPLQRDSVFVAPGRVLTQSTFLAPWLAQYSPPPRP